MVVVTDLNPEQVRRVKLLRTAIDGYLGADRALDALVAELLAQGEALAAERKLSSDLSDMATELAKQRESLREALTALLDATVSAHPDRGEVMRARAKALASLSPAAPPKISRG
jgi:hypothetical protein